MSTSTLVSVLALFHLHRLGIAGTKDVVRIDAQVKTIAEVRASVTKDVVKHDLIQLNVGAHDVLTRGKPTEPVGALIVGVARTVAGELLCAQRLPIALVATLQ